MSVNSQNISEEDTFKILVATDNHIGYGEKDPIRGKDSLNTFEEILQLAQENDVDFILLGGDLFHDNRPSRKCIHDTMKLIRKYCLGDKPVKVELISDQSENFKYNSFPHVNYEDENLNVSIPIFSIHGNHDDPTGVGNLCSLDLFSVTGLVNYFGKTSTLEKIDIFPLLMQKGCTKLSIYGLGAVRGERLHRLFRDGKVSTLRPKEDQEDWFNMFVIHQNRVIRNVKDHVPGYFLDDYMDLIIWGHEHECRIDPEFEKYSGKEGFYVSQPGSSVATSLSAGEAVPKHVGLLEIYKKNFKMSKLPLKTVRQFYMEDISIDSLTLKDSDSDKVIQKKVNSFLCEKIDQILENAALERIDNDKIPDKPLVRLRIPTELKEKIKDFSIQRFGFQYIDQVANPKEMLSWLPKRQTQKNANGALGDFDKDELQMLIEAIRSDQTKVEDIVQNYFTNAKEDLKLFLLTEVGLRIAVNEYVEKGLNESIREIFKHQVKKMQNYLNDKEIDEGDIDKEIQVYREERLKNVKEEITESRMALSTAGQNSKARNDDITILSDDDDDDSPPPTRGRGRGGSTRGRKKATENGGDTTPKRGRGSRGRGRGRAAATKSGPLDAMVQRQSRSRGASKAENSDDDFADNTQAASSNNRATKRKPSNGRKGPVYDDDDSTE